MVLIPTALNEIDRKLHRIILDSNPEKFSNMMALAREIEKNQCDEFSYTRTDKTEYANANTIVNYISYARTVTLLDGDLASTRPKNDVKELGSFQAWISDAVFQYLSNSNSSNSEISAAIQVLIQQTPCVLPTQRNVYAKLKNPPPFEIFRMSLKIVSLLRPAILGVRTRRVILMPGIIAE